MNKKLLFLSLLTAAGVSANDFPNNSFEYDLLPLWNRMPSEALMPKPATPWTYSSDCTSGKRSLHLKGRPLELLFETNTIFRPNQGGFSLKMKAPRTTQVKVKCFLNTSTNSTRLFEKSFNVTDQWQTFDMVIGNPFANIRRSGYIYGPVKLIVDPGSAEVLIDDCQTFSGKRGSSRFIPGPVGGVPEKEMAVPAYIPLPSAASFAKGQCSAGSWEFRLFQGRKGAEKNVPLSGVMLFPVSKVFFNSGTFALYDGTKELPARFYPIAAWPKDRSLAALKVDFTADAAKKPKTLQLRFTPQQTPRSTPAVSASGVFSFPNGLEIKDSGSNLWEKNGSLGKAVLTGVDYTGKKYTFKALSFHQENGAFLRRGKLLSSDGLSIGTADIRISHSPAHKGVKLDIAIANTSKKFIPIREIYWQCEAPGNSDTLSRLIWGDYRTRKFTEVQERAGKKSRSTVSGSLSQLPQFTLSSSKGISVHVFNGAQTFPNEIKMAPGMIKGALWPASAKALSLAPGLTLRKQFFVSPAPLTYAPDFPAAVMPAAKHFADSKVMISMCAANPKRQPFFENLLKGGLGRLSYPELHNRFCYGQFNYGDHPGDGGWGNLESFEDYVLFHRAMREENPSLFQLAQIASRHYADIDTDIRSAQTHIHSANHIIGGNGFGHAWLPGVMSAWLLTGDPAIYQSARRMLDACVKLPLHAGEIQQGRNFGFYLLTLAEGYATFNDPAIAKRYMEQLKYQVKRFDGKPATALEANLQRTSIPRQNSIFYVTSSGLVPFHCWYGLTAFLKMYQLTGAPLIKEVFEKEFANIMNMEMTYRPQIETHWPGMAAEKLFPTIATDYLLGRGAFFYPVLAMYAKISGKKEYIDLALDTLYCGLLASRGEGNIQDVFMASPLADAPSDFNEAKQLEKVRKLLWEGAAPQMLNGDFSTSLLYSDLVIPKKGIGAPRYPVWAVKKPYPRWWHFVEGKQIISSTFMTLRGDLYDLDNKEFGKAAPSLRLNMSTKRYCNAGDLTSAKFRMLPGEWEYAISFKNPVDAEIKQLGMRIMAFGNFATRLGVTVTSKGEVIRDNTSDERFKIYALSCKETGKAGWKRLTFRFRLKEKSLGCFRIRYNMLPRKKQGFIHIDDVEIKRVEN